MICKADIIHNRETKESIINNFLSNVNEATIFIVLHAIDSYFSKITQDKNKTIVELINIIIEKHGFHVVEKCDKVKKEYHEQKINCYESICDEV